MWGSKIAITYLVLKQKLNKCSIKCGNMKSMNQVTEIWNQRPLDLYTDSAVCLLDNILSDIYA